MTAHDAEVGQGGVRPCSHPDLGRLLIQRQQGLVDALHMRGKLGKHLDDEWPHPVRLAAV